MSDTRFRNVYGIKFGWLAIIAVLVIAVGVFLAYGPVGERQSPVYQIAPKTQIVSPSDN